MFSGLTAVLLTMSWLQPLHLSPWVSWHSEVLAFLAAGAMAMGILRAKFKRNDSQLDLPIATSIPFTLLSIIITQTAIGRIGFLGDSIVLATYTFMCGVALVSGFAAQTTFGPATSGHQRQFPPLQVLAIIMIGAAVLSVALALVQTLGVWESVESVVQMPSWRRPGANLGQPNQLATLLVMAVASLAYVYESRRLSAPTASLIFVVLMLGLALTESRSGLAGVAGLFIWWWLRRKQVFPTTSLVAVVGGVSLLLVLVSQWPNFIEHFQAGGLVGEKTQAKINLNAGTRLVVWPQLIEAVLQRPWFGWGLREVSTAHNSVLQAYSTGEPFTYAHNIVLELAIGVGLPLTLALCFVVGVWAYRRIRAAQTLDTWFCLAVILPLGVHSMFEFPFAYSYFILPAFFVVGYLESALAHKSIITIPLRHAGAVFAAATAAMVWSAAEYPSLEDDFRIARFEALRIGKTPQAYESPHTIWLTQLAALNEISRLTPHPGMTSEKIDLTRKVAMRFPWNATQNRYALTLALNGNAPEAVRQLKVMRAMHGEKNYLGIKASWQELANTKYPQLLAIDLP